RIAMAPMIDPMRGKPLPSSCLQEGLRSLLAGRSANVEGILDSVSQRGAQHEADEEVIHERRQGAARGVLFRTNKGELSVQ
ncbi:hypothetical protein SB690_20580, partial [Bacillus sp. SIMBA_006]|uniref:hypothetical protein n=1 Tax=Bacillus sp. SIMBA_006 TaxID=3085755 RepID=UPI00397C0408